MDQIRQLEFEQWADDAIVRNFGSWGRTRISMKEPQGENTNLVTAKWAVSKSFRCSGNTLALAGMLGARLLYPIEFAIADTLATLNIK